MKKNLQLLLILSIVFTNCKTQNCKDQYSYENIFIPDSLFYFYPDKSDDIFPIFYSTNAIKNNDPIMTFYDYNCYDYIQIFKFEKMEKFNQIISNLRMKMIDSIDISKGNYSIIGDQLDIEQQLTNSLNQVNYLNFGKNEIILSFKDKIDSDFQLETKCGLNKSYKIYILMKGYEFILPQKYYSDNTFLPKGFRHGYLSGVAYSIEEQKIIYWTCAW